MTQKSPPHRLNAIVRSRVNQVAHRLGQAHENAMRATLLDRLTTATVGGASVAELNALIDELEAPLGSAQICAVIAAPAHMGASHAA